MRRLSILWHCDALAWSNELPSWVPNWNVKLPYRDLNLGLFGGGQGAFETRNILGALLGDRLMVDGVICGVVAKCSATVSEEVTVLEVTSMIRKLYQRAFDASLPPTEETMVGLCHALTIGYIGKRYPESFKPAGLQAAIDIITYILQTSTPIETLRDIPLPEVTPFFFHMNNALPHRKLFTIYSGQIGLGPSDSQSSDKIISIIGSQRLMLLRDSPMGYRIVGVCYLHGFTNMEAILGPLPEECSVELVWPCYNPWNMRFVRGCEAEPQDPRLDGGFEGWSCTRRDRDGTIVWDHDETSTATRSDPRHTDVDFLKRRGAVTEDICIV
jgi:hypothetical protein